MIRPQMSSSSREGLGATAQLDAVRQSAIVPLSRTFAVLSLTILSVLTPFMIYYRTVGILVVSWVWAMFIVASAFWPRVPMRVRATVLVLAPLLTAVVVFLTRGPLAIPMASGCTAVVVASLVFSVRVGLGCVLVVAVAMFTHLLGVLPASVDAIAANVTNPGLDRVAEAVGSVPMLGMALAAISLVVSRLRESLVEAKRLLAEQGAEVRARERVEAELRASEEHLRGIFELVPEAISVLALPDLEIIDINPGFTQIYGWTREEACGRSIAALGLVPLPDATESLSTRLLNEHKLTRMEARLPRRDGKLVDVEFNTRMATLGDRKVLVSVTRDVTDEKRMAATFHHRQRIEAMGDLVAGISHNFNNALASVLPNVEAALERCGPELREYLDDARLAAKSAVDLARQLTLFARHDADPKLEVIDVPKVVKDVLAIARETFDRRVKVELSSTVDHAYLRAPPGRLEQVFLNLCINARDAIENVAEPWLCVAIEMDPGGMLVVTAVDNGMGMTEASLQRLGEPFFTTKPLGRGTGLGLASAYGIIAELGGRIACTSKVGKGTTFKVMLPIDAKVMPQSSPRIGVAAPFAGQRVLVIDDDALVRKAFQRMLVRLGLDPILADGGREGLMTLARHPDVRAVLLDLNMPGMSGNEVLAEVRQQFGALPVVVITGNVAPGPLPEASAVLNKPTSTAQLLEVLRRLIV